MRLDAPTEHTPEDEALNRELCSATFEVLDITGEKVGEGGRLRQGGNLVLHVKGWEPSFGTTDEVVDALLRANGMRLHWTWFDPALRPE